MPNFEFASIEVKLRKMIDFYMITRNSNKAFNSTLAPEVRSQNTQDEIKRAYGLIRPPKRYSFLLGASRLLDAASPLTISIDNKKISSGTQGSLTVVLSI